MSPSLSNIIIISLMVELKMRPSCFLVQLLIRCFRMSDFSTSTSGFPPIWKMNAGFVHLLKATIIKNGWPDLLGFVFQNDACLKKPWICSSQEWNPIFYSSGGNPSVRKGEAREQKQEPPKAETERKRRRRRRWRQRGQRVDGGGQAEFRRRNWTEKEEKAAKEEGQGPGGPSNRG